MSRTYIAIPGAEFVVAKTSPFLLIPEDTNNWVFPRFIGFQLDAGSIPFGSGGGVLQLKFGGGAFQDLVTGSALYAQTVDKVSYEYIPQYGQIYTLSTYMTGGVYLGLKTADLNTVGGILTSSLNAAGSGYVAGDTGTVNTGDTNAIYTVLTVNAGAVVTYAITSPGGSGYSVANAVATTAGGAQAGIGTGFKINILSIAPGNGNLVVVLHYAKYGVV